MKNPRTTICAIVIAVSTAISNSGFSEQATKIARLVQDAATAVALVFAREQAQHEEDKKKAQESNITP